MEKLIQLLNEYERSKRTNLGIKVWGCLYWSLSYLWYGNSYSELLCISKGYDFIQRLVENNKIDLENLIIKKVEDRGWNKVIKDIKYYSEVESLLMLLSISDTPIEDLISYLK